MPNITVVHINSGKKGIYIGRDPKNAFHYGNPFAHKKGTMAKIMVADRETAIDCYREWLKGTRFKNLEPLRRDWILEQIPKIRAMEGNVNLICFCKPFGCHGDVLKEMIAG